MTMIIQRIGQRQVQAIDLLCDQHDSDGDPRFIWHIDSGAEGWGVRVGVGEELVTLEGEVSDLGRLSRALAAATGPWRRPSRQLARRIDGRFWGAAARIECFIPGAGPRLVREFEGTQP